MRVGRWRPVSGAARGRAGAGGEAVLLPSSSKFRVRGRGWGRGHKIKKISGPIYKSFSKFFGFQFFGFRVSILNSPSRLAGATSKFSLLPTLAFSKSGAGLRKTENAGTPQGQPVPQFIQFYINSSFPRRCRCRSGHPLRGARTTALRQTTLEAHLPYFLP